MAKKKSKYERDWKKLNNQFKSQVCYEIEIINIRRSPVLSGKPGLYDYLFDVKQKGKIVAKDFIFTAKSLPDFKRILKKFIPIVLNPEKLSS